MKPENEWPVRVSNELDECLGAHALGGERTTAGLIGEA